MEGRAVLAALVALGGAAGAVSRWWIGEWIAARAPGAFPWPTFAVNVAGSLALGVLLGALAPGEAPRARALLATGFCGGFTTFSTFGAETVALLQGRAYGVAAAYVGASVAAGLLAVVAGMAAGGVVSRAG